MAQTVVLLRHGESADKQHSQSDFDRMLTPQGNGSVERLGLFLTQEKLIPEIILSSDAVRTKQTTEVLMRVFETNNPLVKYKHELYHGIDKTYLNLIAQINPSTKIIMVVGHNPSISSLIGLITGDYAQALHPGQATLIRFDNTIGERSGKLVKLIEPFLK